jgi:hypothetical protein
MQQLPTVRPPADDAFVRGDDFMIAPEIEQRADMLRERHNLPVGITLAYRWKRKGGKSSDKAVVGKCVKLSGPAKHFGQVDFLIWLAADHCRELKYTQDQYTALVYHELLHAGVNIDEETFEETPALKQHDVTAFVAEVRDYGLWMDDLADFVAAAEQAPLFAAAAD